MLYTVCSKLGKIQLALKYQSYTNTYRIYSHAFVSAKEYSTVTHETSTSTHTHSHRHVLPQVKKLLKTRITSCQ